MGYLINLFIVELPNQLCTPKTSVQYGPENSYIVYKPTSKAGSLRIIRRQTRPSSNVQTIHSTPSKIVVNSPAPAKKKKTEEKGEFFRSLINYAKSAHINSVNSIGSNDETRKRTVKIAPRVVENEKCESDLVKQRPTICSCQKKNCDQGDIDRAYLEIYGVIL